MICIKSPGLKRLRRGGMELSDKDMFAEFRRKDVLVLVQYQSVFKVKQTKT
jgi:hypothetical protein